MHNAEMVDAILDGQGDGLAPAYDRYASALYGYCRSLLGEPDAAGPAAPVPAPLVPGAAATTSAVAVPSARSVSPAGSRSPASPSPGPSAGTLAASPALVTLHLNPAGLAYVGSFTLTAQGGPISSFRISNPDPLDLAIRPSTGSLAPGQTVTVRLTVLAPLRVFSSHLALNPGTQAVIVHYPPAR